MLIPRYRDILIFRYFDVILLPFDLTSWCRYSVRHYLLTCWHSDPSIFLVSWSFGSLDILILLWYFKILILRYFLTFWSFDILTFWSFDTCWHSDPSIFLVSWSFGSLDILILVWYFDILILRYFLTFWSFDIWHSDPSILVDILILRNVFFYILILWYLAFWSFHTFDIPIHRYLWCFDPSILSTFWSSISFTPRTDDDLYDLYDLCDLYDLFSLHDLDLSGQIYFRSCMI